MMFNNKKLLDRLDQMLEDGINGTFTETSYDESRLSSIESKWYRYLTSSKLSSQKINLEQEKIKELVTDISHQTKTPLTNIELYTQLLQEQNLDETSKFLADEIQKQALKLEFLIQSLIKTSRLETGTLQFNPKANSINNLIAKAVDQAEKKALKKNITVICEKESTTAIFDLKWTVEALFNIIDNAVKYTNENGTITISVKSYELFACISIQDNGIGIAEEEQEKIFGRFNRGSNVSETEGTGIGLYLSREIIEKQGAIFTCSRNWGKVRYLKFIFQNKSFNSVRFQKDSGKNKMVY